MIILIHGDPDNRNVPRPTSTCSHQVESIVALDYTHLAANFFKVKYKQVRESHVAQCRWV